MLAINAIELLKMSPAQLDARYQSSPAGEIPRGEGKGTVLFASGSGISAPVARFMRWTAWQGKVFDPERGELRNLITPFGIKSFVAKVYQAPSWTDGNPCIVLDYSRSALIARLVRDEIRLVAPGLYLGIAYLGKLKVIHFALEFSS